MRHITKVLTVGLLCLGLVANIGCKGASGRLEGGGSSFIGPLMVEKWVKIYHDQKNVEINYQITGSGDGVEGVISNARQFGCSDAPLTPEQIEKAGGEKAVVQIPLVVGAVVPIYNLPDLKEPVKFTGELLGLIYLGKITEWNDDRLTKDNKQLIGRKETINAIHRSGSSGTTYIWTDYLCKTCPQWKAKYKVPQTKPAWEGKQGEGTNDAVAKGVGSAPGTIGYVELTYALKKKQSFQMGLVRNAHEEYIKADLKTARAAADHLAKVPEDLSKLSFVNAPGKDSYPIVGTTWAVVKVQQTPENAKLLKDFLHWAINEGQKYTEQLDYVPLPKSVIEAADKKIALIGGGS